MWKLVYVITITVLAAAIFIIVSEAQAHACAMPEVIDVTEYNISPEGVEILKSYGYYAIPYDDCDCLYLDNH